MKYLLGEINLYNPQYPVKRMYKQLKKKKSQAEGSKSENTQRQISKFRTYSAHSETSMNFDGAIHKLKK